VKGAGNIVCAGASDKVSGDQVDSTGRPDVEDVQNASPLLPHRISRPGVPVTLGIVMDPIGVKR
jgi:hypothetical protein